MTKAILLVNLGSPDAPTVRAVRRYLREFLMDSRVLDVNWLARFCIVHFGILPTRPKQSTHAYQAVWTPEGSPLVAISRRVQAGLEAKAGIPVELGMRYQHPSIAEAIRRLADRGATEVAVIPLFPHYAMSSYETAVERVREVAARLAPQIRILVQPPFYDHPEYISALANSVREQLTKGYDHLLFSFHGLPERHMRKADPTGRHCLKTADCCESPSPAHATCYRAQCFKTVAAFVQEAGVPAGKFSVSFQSRLGREPWLKPYTDLELPRLAGQGVKRLVVMCPAFVSDCLETLEEIGIRGRETFLGAGGQEFKLLPCLNDHPLWLEALEKMAARLAPAAANPPARSAP
jgi:ferrochelatase